VNGSSSALDTKLGYLSMGETDVNGGEDPVSAFTYGVDFDLTRFWKEEEAPTQEKLSPEEREVEERFALTYTQTDEGKFVVELPFVPEHKPLGESRSQALRRIFQLERRLERDPAKKELYHKATQGYIDEGHLVELKLSNADLPVDKKFYLPHH